MMAGGRVVEATAWLDACAKCSHTLPLSGRSGTWRRRARAYMHARAAAAPSPQAHRRCRPAPPCTPHLKRALKVLRDPGADALRLHVVCARVGVVGVEGHVWTLNWSVRFERQQQAACQPV